ncbi:ATP-binding cassette domain-containing protein [Algirhabdus cladophorae]|uniref:ATP-binding cassette domain-containing protein n=1 Tax=Algirhabdus cladophorae TaxID=3377108 RepID=UPI003B848DD1
MTGPVLAFDINARADGALRQVRKSSKSKVQVKPELADKYSDRAKTRADLASVYAGLLGVETSVSDLLESMVPDADINADGVAPGDMARALKSAGLATEIATINACTADHWPAIAVMTSGQFLLVLGQSQGMLTLHDTTCPDNRAEVPVAEFEPYFTGLIVRAEVTVKHLDKVHSTKSRANHWFWGEFPKYRRHLAEIGLASFVANLLAVSVALFSLQVYDRVIPHQSTSTLWVLAIGAALALLMEAFLKIARARLMDGAGRKIEMSVQNLLMERVLGMKSGMQGLSPSALFSAMREFGSVREFFTASTIGTLTDIPFILLFLVIVSSIAGPVVWVLVIGGILMVVPGLLFQKRMIELTKKNQGASAKSSRLLHEAIYEADTVKGQRGEERFRRIWTELTALSSITSSEQRKLSSALTFWSQGVQQATYVSAVVVGAYMVFAGEFTIGTIIAVGILTSRTLAPLTQLSGTMARWTNVKAALDGLEGVALAPQDFEEDRTYLRRETLRGEFELRDVSFRYDQDQAPNIDIPGLMVRPGQRLAILGSNGSGKSTLLKVMSGLYSPTAGRVLLDGVEMSQVHPKDIRRNLGYLSQDVRLFAGSLRDNLNLNMLERDDSRLFAALDFAGIGAYVRSHPKGLDLEISDGGEGLSIGQRQSIGWARIWLQDPKIVLLDEPTAALDQTLEKNLVARLEDWLKDRTAIIATHRVPILALTNRTLILQNGRLAVDGPRDQVLQHLNDNNKRKAG